MSRLKYNIYLNDASKTFSDRGFEVILAIVLTLGSLALMFFFPIAGIALMIFSYGFLCIGTKTVLLGIVRGEFLPIETVFSKINICVKAFCLKVATMLISCLWAVVFIVPGIVTALNYSMSSFVMADEDLPALECMVKSKKLVYGHRGEILVIYLAYFFIMFAVLCVFASLGCAMNYYLNIQTWIPLVSMGFLALFVIVIFIIPYFELMFAHIYNILKNEDVNFNKTIQPKRKNTKKSTNQELLTE